MSRVLKPSTPTVSDPKLSESARHLIIPEGIVSTEWPAVRSMCNRWGVKFWEWQDGLGQVVFGVDADGIYAATVGGVIISIPRQVAKTWWVGRVLMAMCALHPGFTVLWTAHRLTTTNDTFGKMAAFCQQPQLKPFVRSNGIRRTNGQQKITFTNGSTISFGAREQGFGRGFTEVDAEVFDESQILTEKATDDMIAATNQARHEHGALLFYMCTPPAPHDPSEIIEAKRNTALSHKDDLQRFGGVDVGGDAVMVEYSADKDAKPDDQNQWRKANVSFAIGQTPLSSMKRLRSNLSDDSWKREGLGIWDDSLNREPPVFDIDAWDLASVELEAVPEFGQPSYGIKFGTDGVAIAGAFRTDAGVFVEHIATRPLIDGIDWVVQLMLEKKNVAIKVMVDGRGSAQNLADRLGKEGFPKRRIAVASAQEAVQASDLLRTSIISNTVMHIGDPVLDQAMNASAKRPIGTTGGWGLVSRNGNSVLEAEAVMLAHFAAATSKPRKQQTGSIVM